MPEARLVRCPDCGHEWESEAKDPRCTDPDDVCGRSRAVVVEDVEDDSPDDRTDDGSTDDASTDSDGRSAWDKPLFETSEERTGSGGDVPEPPSVEDDSDDEGGDDDGDDVDAGETLPELDAEDVRPFLVTAFGGPPTEGDEPIPGFASQSRGEHWQLKDHELDQLSRAYARVGNKYLPYLLAEYTVEGMALLATAMIVAPRLQEDRRRAEREEAQDRDTGSAGAGTVRNASGGSADDEEPESTERQIEELAEADTAGESGWAGAQA